MAAFAGDNCVKEAADFASAFFGDEEFLLGVTPVGNYGRRVVVAGNAADPMLGFDPTSMEPLAERPPMLQPPSLGGRMPPSCGAVQLPSASCDILAPAYKESLLRDDESLLRDDEALGEQQLGVWGRLGRSSSPNLISGVVEVGNGLFHED